MDDFRERGFRLAERLENLVDLVGGGVEGAERADEPGQDRPSGVASGVGDDGEKSEGQADPAHGDGGG